MLKEDLNKVATILQNNIVKELKIPRQAKGYSGQPKRGVSPPIASGNLINNVKVEWVGDASKNDLALVIKMPDYWYYVNYGRKPGRWPPVAPIDRWVVQKAGFKDVIRDQSGRFVSRKSLVFLIRRSIGQYGYQGTEFLQNAYAASTAQIIEELGDGIGNWFLSLFDDFNE